MRKCNNLFSSVIWGGVCILLVGLFPVGVFGMVVEDSSRIILLFQWFQKGFWLKQKTWYILLATPYCFPWQLLQCLEVGLSFSLCLLREPLKMISSLQLNHIRALPMLLLPWFRPSLLPPVAFMHWALLLITNSHLMAACQVASYRLNLCCSLGPGSSATVGDWRFYLTWFCLTFDSLITSPWPGGIVKIRLWLIDTFLSMGLSLAPPPPKVGKVWNAFSVCFF